MTVTLAFIIKNYVQNHAQNHVQIHMLRQWCALKQSVLYT